MDASARERFLHAPLGCTRGLVLRNTWQDVMGPAATSPAGATSHSPGRKPWGRRDQTYFLSPEGAASLRLLIHRCRPYRAQWNNNVAFPRAYALGCKITPFQGSEKTRRGRRFLFQNSGVRRCKTRNDITGAFFAAQLVTRNSELVTCTPTTARRWPNRAR